MDWLSAGATLVAGLIGKDSQEDTNSANRAMSQAQMDFQERMSNTAYQRAVKDMQAAGLSPMLAYSQGPASSPGGSTAVMGNPGTAAANAALASAQILNTKAQTDKLEAETDNVKADTEVKATQMASNLASAGQSQELANKTRQEIQAWLDVNRERAFIARDREWYDAAIARSDSDVKHKTVDYRVAAAAADAERLYNQAKLLGLDVPEGLAKAAFWRSPYGQSKPFVDFGVGTLGAVSNSSSSAKRAFSPSKAK